MKSGILCIVTALSFISACDGEPVESAQPAQPVSQIDLEVGNEIARVGDVPIGEREFALEAMRGKRKAESLTMERKKEILDDLVNQKALYLEARRLGLDKDPKVQAQMVQMLLRRTVYNQVRSNDFTEEDLRNYFESHSDDFVVPEKVRMRRILIKADPVRTSAEAEVLIRDIHAEIGGDIEKVSGIATARSEGQFKNRGGDLGLLAPEGRAGIPKAVIDKAFTMEPGTVSEPFKTEDGWNIIGLIMKRDAIERTFEQMRGAVLRRVKTKRQKQLYEDTITEMRGKVEVSIDEAALESLQLPAMMERAGGPRPDLPPGSRVAPAVPLTPASPPGGEK